MNPRRLLLLLFGLLLMLPAWSAAPSPIQGEIAGARLAGQGTFRWYGLKIYDAQLWVGPKGYDPYAPNAAPLALDLNYARKLVGKKIAESSRDEMKKLNVGSDAQRATWLTKMEAIFPDVQEGTHITGIYLPAVGAKFFLNGKPLGEIADPEFAHAFFAIWLDPKTTGSKLRDALLADAAPHG
jgi:hypothetical protein